jgi:hypothetical protein
MVAVLDNEDGRAVSHLRRALDKNDTAGKNLSGGDEECLTLWGVVQFNYACARLLGDFLQCHPKTCSCISFMFCSFQHQSGWGSSSQDQQQQQQQQVPAIAHPLLTCGLQHCVNLTTLHLKCCSLGGGDDGLNAIVDAILTGRYIKHTLQEFNVRRSQVSVSGLAPLTRLVANCSHLKRLLLRGNPGLLDHILLVQCFCNVLSTNTCLEYLDLDECYGAADHGHTCQHYDDVAAMLFQALTTNKTLRSLDFHQQSHDDDDDDDNSTYLSDYWNSIRMRTRKQLIRFLPFIQGLRELRLGLFTSKHHSYVQKHAGDLRRVCFPADDDDEQLLSSLLRNTSLQRLTYYNNNDKHNTSGRRRHGSVVFPDAAVHILERNQRLARIQHLLFLDVESSPPGIMSPTNPVAAIEMTPKAPTKHYRSTTRRMFPLAMWRLVFQDVLQLNKNSSNLNHSSSSSTHNATVIFFILRHATTDTGCLLVLERRLAAQVA